MRRVEHHCGRYPSESVVIFVEASQVQCCWRALFSDRARFGARAGLISLAVDISKPSDDNQCAVLSLRIQVGGFCP